MSHDAEPQGALTVVANLDLCQGHARCEDLCPQVFATDAVEGKVVVANPTFPPELEEKVRLAVRNCPEGALRISRQRPADVDSASKGTGA